MGAHDFALGGAGISTALRVVETARTIVKVFHLDHSVVLDGQSVTGSNATLIFTKG